MKLLYIWIEEFRNILHQGIIVDDEYSISVDDPDNVVSNYYADDETRIFYTGTSPRFGTKIFDRHITRQKNGAYKRAGSSINSIAAIVGKNAASKSSILECLSAYEPQKIDRHYFLAFLNKDAHCVEIRSRGIHVTADKCVQANVSTHENHALNKPDVIWFLDEPEMHMHPELNRSFLSDINAAMKEFIDGGYVRSCQLILVTHSPFIVQRLSDYTSSLTLVCKNGHQITTHPFDNLPQLKLPGRSDFSFGLIMFKIFDVPTVELHNELYGVLQEKMVSTMRKI